MTEYDDAKLIETINHCISASVTTQLDDMKERMFKYEAQPHNVIVLHQRIDQLRMQLHHERKLVEDLHETLLNLSIALIRGNSD